MTNSCYYAGGTDRVDLFHLFVEEMSSILDTDDLLFWEEVSLSRKWN